MDRDVRQPGWLPSLGFTLLTFNCGVAVYRSRDADNVSLVVIAYVVLLLLFCCLRLLEAAEPPRRRRLKHGVWGLSTLLTLIFSYRVSVIMPLWVQLLVWAMGAFTVLVGFYAFFLARPAGPLEVEEER